MAADSDTSECFTEVRIDPSAPVTLRQHLAPRVVVIMGIKGLGSISSLCPQVLGAESIIIDLVIVIGPVDSVENPRRRWWRRWSCVDGPWTVAVDNLGVVWSSASHPQAGIRETVVTNS
jgi:hypothetical protein